MLANGDKLIVTKKVSSFLNEGDIVKVVDVTDDGIISFAFGEDFMHMGVMNTAECNVHFAKIEEEKNVATPKITEEYIKEIMEDSEFEAFTSFDKCTIISCRLPNGFVITESSACVSPENYNEEIGTNICLDKIADKIWELEAYRLQQYLWEEECYCCPCCCDDCEECDEEFDECLDTDLDCDDCDDYKCPYNTNESLFDTSVYNN